MFPRALIASILILSLPSDGLGQSLTVDLPYKATNGEAAFTDELVAQLKERDFDVAIGKFEHEFGTFPDHASQADFTVTSLVRFGEEVRSAGADMALLSYPLLATSHAERILALRSEIAERAATELGRQEAFPIGFFGSSDSALFTGAKAMSVKDFEGLKFRTVDPLASQFISDLGAFTTASSSNEAYAAMQAGAIDGTESSIGGMSDFLASGNSLASTVWPEFRSDTGVVMISSATWDKLSPRQHQEIDAAFDAALKAISAQQEAEAAEFFKAYGGGKLLQVVSADVREDIVESARKSFVERYGEEGEAVLSELEAVLEAGRTVKEPERLDDRGDLQLPVKRIFFVTDRRFFPNEALFVNRFGAVPEQASLLRCGELSLDTTGAPLGAYESEIAPKGALLEGRSDCLELVSNGASEKLIFIHGFNNSFEDATSRVLALARDLNLDATDIILWSWPSAGTPRAYSKDESAVERSALRFIKFLRTWDRVDDNLKPMIIAHSMGSRMVGMSVEQMKEKVDRFTIILAAADIDRDLFQSLISNTAARTVLYVSSRDVPLILSHVGNLRRPVGRDNSLGQSNTEVVDLSNRHKDHSHVFISHGAFDDLRELARTKASPVERGLIKRTKDGAVYWELPTSN